MQSMPITTKVVSSNPAHGEVYSLQLYVMESVSGLQQLCGFKHVYLKFEQLNIPFVPILNQLS